MILIIAFVGGGYMMTAEGKDPLTRLSTVKSAALNSDQINVSFQQVGGHVIEKLVDEGQKVKQGDVLLKLDPTDINLEISKLKANIQSVDVEIKKTNDAIHVAQGKLAIQKKQAEIGAASAETQEALVNDGTRKEDIAKQKAAVSSAQDSVDQAQLSYDRTKSLLEQGAIAQAEFDRADTQLKLAKQGLEQQQEMLNKMKNGARDLEKKLADLNSQKAQTAVNLVDQTRLEIENQKLGIDLLRQKKEVLQTQLKSLLVQKERLVLKAPRDGEIINVMAEIGENVASGAPVVLLESNKLYYDLYVPEDQISKFKENGLVKTNIIGLHKTVDGKVQFIQGAPGFTTLSMTREQGQADLRMFQIRVYIDRAESIRSGMTVEVNLNEAAKK